MTEPTTNRASRARVAAAARWASPETAARLKRDHKTMMLEQHVRRVVDTAPPLTADQLARLRTLLTPAPAGTAPVHAEAA